MLKQNKGITLVALVITIIVLLILAGVSISLVVGDNGVLTQAKDSAVKTSVSEAKERVEQAISSIQGKFTGVWSLDNTKLFINFLNTTDSGVDGTFTNNMGEEKYSISYTGPASGNTEATAMGTGSIKVNGVYYWFRVKGTTNGLGSSICWCTTTTTNTTAPTDGWATGFTVS